MVWRAMTYEIVLPEHWMKRCAEVGLIFHNRAKERGYKQRDNRVGTEPVLRLDVQGCRAEKAFCMWLGVEWKPDLNGFGHADVEGRYHIRSRFKHGRGMLVYPKDPDMGIAVLVTGENPYRIMGWARYGECKLEQYVDKDNRNATFRYVVPHRYLHPMQSLPGLEDYPWAHECAMGPTRLDQLGLNL